MGIRKTSFNTGLLLALLLAGTAVADSDALPAGFDCIITPSKTVDLGSAVPGQLREVLVDRSDRVIAGQVVAGLDSRIEQASLAIASYRAETDTELSLSKTVFEIDRRTEKRLSALTASEVASALDRDRASREAQLSAWRVLQAKDDMVVHDLEMSRAAAALDRLLIRSPIDGVVQARLHHPGEYIDNQPLLRIVKLDPLYVEVILPMRLFGKVKPGMTTSVFPELNGGIALEAMVDVVDPMGDAGSGTFGARLTLPNPQGTIPAGVKCRVKLQTTGLETVESMSTSQTLAQTDEPE